MENLVLSDKVAIVTGAARNMGRAFAEKLAEMGADVVVHHHTPTSRPDAEKTAQGVAAAGRKALVVDGDLSQVNTVKAIFDRTFERLGRVDILINAAGLVLKKPLSSVTESEFDRSFGVNTKAAFFAMQEASKRMQDNGRIINIGTTLQAATAPNYSVYAGAKAPLEDFTRALALEIGMRGITVNTVAPGPVDTSFYHGQETEDSAAFAASRVPARRLGRIEDIVPLVAFLASPGSQWITAQTIFINGGYIAR